MSMRPKRLTPEVHAKILKIRKDNPTLSLRNIGRRFNPRISHDTIGKVLRDERGPTMDEFRKPLRTRHNRSDREKFLFTVHCPVEEIWVMQVEAYSKEEALSLLKDGSAYQVCSFSGTTRSGRNEVVRKEKINGD